MTVTLSQIKNLIEEGWGEHIYVCINGEYYNIEIEKKEEEK